MDQARNAGFTQVVAPSLVKPRAMEGTGFLGQAADDVYRIEGEDLYLVGTSEVAMAAYHSDEILDAAALPRRYAAFSPCFRKEAGSHGKDTKGIIRVHWFDKVEMFVYTTVEESYAEHQRLLAWEKEFLDKLEVAYRVIDVAAGDLGLSAQRKFDCEVWIPTQGKFRELTSTSNCTDFQSRRLDIPREEADQLWIVASNGAVVFRYPPMDVVHEETFDAAPAVAAVLEHHPDALVAVEERGVGGYRVNRVFPPGELSGEQLITEVGDIVGEPVSRVIIRDPAATADDFIGLAARLGLHGTDYVVGWTAWMDLSPVGVSKASGLQHVCDKLGLGADEVLAIGDGRNDIEMLRWAGRGVAMGQSVDEVKAAADHVTASVNDEGAAVELSRWF
jgi:hydroxymethylpyrimidine pyrophosphatase-like HAD family hydrolase